MKFDLSYTQPLIYMTGPNACISTTGNLHFIHRETRAIPPSKFLLIGGALQSWNVNNSETSHKSNFCISVIIDHSHFCLSFATTHTLTSGHKDNYIMSVYRDQLQLHACLAHNYMYTVTKICLQDHYTTMGWKLQNVTTISRYTTTPGTQLQDTCQTWTAV